MCSHKEADTWLLLHVADAVQKGFRKVYACTVNTDDMILVIAMFDCICPEELWIAFGTGSNIIIIPQNSCCDGSKSLCYSNNVFHAITGCDTTSSFAGKDKHCKN